MLLLDGDYGLLLKLLRGRSRAEAYGVASGANFRAVREEGMKPTVSLLALKGGNDHEGIRGGAC